ncbi:MAG TPA: hypothetical protein PKI93_07575 [Alphaproteobacteria bacterium]|nr:hypothetical protein [Alphaproteobacteria bacterium]HNS44981.1 hypothetical protein [Alphaproteobacteria bacterium]
MNLKELETAIKAQLGRNVPEAYAKQWESAFNDKSSAHTQIQRLKDLSVMIGHGKHGFEANTGLQLAILEHIRDTYDTKDNKKMMGQALRDIKTLQKMGVKAVSLESSATVTEQKVTTAPVEETPKTPVAAALTETVAETTTPPAEAPKPQVKEPALSQGEAHIILDSAKFVAGEEFKPEFGIYVYDGKNPHAMIHVWEDEGMAQAREVPLSEDLDDRVSEQTGLVAVRAKDPVRALLGAHDENADVARSMIKNYLYMDSEGFKFHKLLEAEKNPQNKDFRENAAAASNDATYAANDPEYGGHRASTPSKTMERLLAPGQ